MKRFLICILIVAAPLWAKKSKAKQVVSEIDKLIAETAVAAPVSNNNPGSLYDPAGRFGDVSRDIRARQVNDLVTVIVSERSTAEATGTTDAKRKSSASGGISTIFSKSPAMLGDMVKMSGDTSLAGEGSTSRKSALTTTLTARVSHVLPNGVLVIEGSKEVMVNSERQYVKVRGLARTHDLSAANQIISDRLGMLEIQLNGKGVVGDAVRRPNFLYRLLAGLLPF